MKIFGEVHGFDSLAARFAKLTPQVKKAIGDELAVGILKIQGDAIKSIQAQGSKSRDEIRYSPKRTVRVSQPGKPPNSDTGMLVKSIGWEFDREKLVGRVGTNLEYGAILELSPNSSVRRPWLEPAYRRNIEAITLAIARAIDKEIE